MSRAKRSLAEWSRRAEARLGRVIAAAGGTSGLKRLGPKGPWLATVKVVSGAAMKRLNSTYRRKHYATDVLSFGAPEPFRSQGYLGELVVCGPVMERQARDLGHSPERELDVLLVHGLLHLMGLDHEKSRLEAKRMANLERRILKACGGRLGSAQGLIGRAR